MHNHSSPSQSISEVARGRWNVLDLITTFGKEAIPAYLFCDIDMTRAESIKDHLHLLGHDVTYTAILIKAIGMVQRSNSLSRTIILPWGGTYTFPHVAAGLTVERLVDGKPLVFFGLVKSPDQKSLEEIAVELKQYASDDIALVPQLALEEQFSRMPWLIRQAILFAAKCYPDFRRKFLGSTFGLTSLGKFGIQSLIGPCVCTATFGIGSIELRPVVFNRQIVKKAIMTLSLGVDSRVMDLGSAASLLTEVQRVLEGCMELPGIDRLNFDPSVAYDPICSSEALK
jgi:hypothetical protein